ncbi:MAG: diaminopimelate dehydrogenase [Firmicutes bacterium]|nr:diaminopimelate dehydrogenase [Bacillota bacterium]
MNEKIRIGIVGYGNLGKGVISAIEQNDDMELVAVFTRRPADSITITGNNIKVLNNNSAQEYVNDINVMILCGGSSSDIPLQGPLFASLFNTVDGYDNHKKIFEYFKSMDVASKESGKTSAICAGWDPGLFSINRVLLESVLPQGTTYTFWGPGVSQGHSDAVRRVSGVKNAVQYTLPIEDSMKKVRNGENPNLTIREKHKRICYVVAKENADICMISENIKSMPNYFEDYDTDVIFISEEELIKNHSKMLHGGFVIRSGKTGKELTNNHIAEFSLKLGSNAEFTANVLVTYARAVHRLNKEGIIGAKTIMDIPLKYLTQRTFEDICANLM